MAGEANVSDPEKAYDAGDPQDVPSILSRQRNSTIAQICTEASYNPFLHPDFDVINQQCKRSAQTAWEKMGEPDGLEDIPYYPPLVSPEERNTLFWLVSRFEAIITVCLGNGAPSTGPFDLNVLSQIRQGITGMQEYKAMFAAILEMESIGWRLTATDGEVERALEDIDSLKHGVVDMYDVSALMQNVSKFF